MIYIAGIADRDHFFQYGLKETRADASIFAGSGKPKV